MPEDISIQILTQTAENIQQLFNLSSRIDEKVKAVKEQQEDLSKQISTIAKDYTEIMKKVAVLESHSGNEGLSGVLTKIEQQNREISVMDKRLSTVEAATDNNQDRWKTITSFLVQLVWIIIAAWALMRLGISQPPLP
jgi:predicted  nucleic acid-binding Zn-ribbon protein